MSTQVGALPEALRNQRQLGVDERFTFACHPGLRCFTRCCADINILLTPLDVLRLARRRGMTTREFLDTHTLTPITKDLHLPLVMLRMGEEPERRCPFVHTETGCTVYEERPWACRMYPLGMALPPARAGVEPQPLYVMFEEDFCLGRGEKREWTVDRWRNDQGVAAHDEIEAGFREIVSHPWFIGGRQLDPKRMEMYFTGCYDLDTFRSFVFESTFLRRFDLDEALVEKLRTDDMELFRFAFRWLRYALFGEPTMKVRPDAPSTRRNK